MRGKPFRAGFHDYTIAVGGLLVFPRLVAAEHPNEFDSAEIKSGIDGLDALMAGGLERGTSTLIMGPAGSGKSTLATQYAVAADERGERAALFLFEESLRTLISRSAGLGRNIEASMAAGRLSFRQIDPGALSPGEFVHHVRHEVEQQGASVVVIDSLKGYLNAMHDVRFQNLQLHELLT